MSLLVVPMLVVTDHIIFSYGLVMKATVEFLGWVGWAGGRGGNCVGSWEGAYQ